MKIRNWINNIKWEIERRWVINKYRHNYNTGKIIYLNINQRGLGLTDIIIKDALKNNTFILVATQGQKRFVIGEILRLANLGFDEPISKDMAERMVITPDDAHRLRGSRGDRILIDNACHEQDITKIVNASHGAVIIYNGFVTKKYS
jgi:hypothetical protein